MKCRVGVKTFLVLSLIMSFLSVCLSFPALSSGQEKGEVKQMIFGKEYRVEKGVKEGKEGYWCYWGEDKAWWEFKPWYLDSLKEKGPLCYDLYTQPGLPFPFDGTLKEREKWKGFHWAMRGIMLASGCQMMDDYCDEGRVALISPKGRIRAKKYFEWNLNYISTRHNGHWPLDKPNELIRKYAYEYREPEDVSGLGSITWTYSGPKKEDENWYYSPSVRKVRRLSTGARQDFFPGSVGRNEDVYLTKPVHEYKILRTELHKDPGSEYYGYGNSETELKVKRMDGIGEPCVVVEVTLPEGWYCAKQIRWYGIKSTGCWREDAYDKKGRLIRHFAPTMSTPPNPPEPWYINWQGWWFHDLNTGYKTNMVWLDWRTEPGVSEQTFDEGFLLREVSRMIWWR